MAGRTLVFAGILALSGCGSCSDRRADADGAPSSSMALTVGPDAQTPERPARKPPPAPLPPAPEGCAALDPNLWLVAEGAPQRNDGGAASTLYRYDVVTEKLSKVGELSCAPRSIAIDRAKTMWGSSHDGKLFTIDVNDARCTPTKFRPGQSGFSQFQMTFAYAAGKETFYASDEHYEHGDPTASLGLATIDPKSLKLTKLGKYDNGDPMNELPCSVAGTGDGRLYAVCVGAEVWRVGKIEAGRVQLETVATRGAWLHPLHLRPVAFWGNALWSFSHPCDERPEDERCAEYGSRVSRYSLAEHTPKVVKEDLGITVTAVTSSTCAGAL